MIKIPKKAFEEKAEGGDAVLPEVGDSVMLDGFTGTVKSEDGDNLVVELKEFKGQPVSYVEEADEESPEDEKSKLLGLMNTEED